ncbi:hypothetical protein BBF96_14725 [Anoxybacter fermentans]|uniref:ABC transporter permease n=1 Tax=Anoxybacter fermentans TaxID=1323375 RepID=A0A3Q9HSR1_9FIRM|nr:ABC transporter permease subunit [Anoxybacter fermentans]AZR74529.1 hypothetical protein BBF96_14725 [Anoxybacter fermentans]
MIYIIKNVIREQIRNRTVLIIAILALIFNYIITTGGGLKINGQKVTEFNQLLFVGISIVVFFGSMLTIFLSMNTIPKEFERKTTHLVLVRPIEKWQYILALVLGNICISLIIFGILAFSLLFFIIFYGRIEYWLRLIVTYLILSTNIATLSAIVSICSVKMSPIFAGMIGFIAYILGVLHDLFITMAQLTEGSWLKLVVFLTPNIVGVQREAAAFLNAKPVKIHIILEMIIFLYLVLWGTLFLFRKEV